MSWNGGLLLEVRRSKSGSNSPARNQESGPAVHVLRAYILVVVLLAAATGARAHNAGAGSEKATEHRGLEIPSITHSDMAIVSRYHSAIVKLAERQTSTDERLRRLLNYAKIQNTYCLWGLVPGAVTDENNSFNPCSHAYLAASWALLQHLATRQATRVSAASMLRSIELDRAAFPSPVICQSSAETFHTHEFIVPIERSTVAGWLTSLMMGVSLTAGAVRLAIARSRRER